MIDHQRMLDCLKIYQQKKLEEQGIADTENQVELLEKDEMVATAISEISQVDAKALPSVISQQFTKITDLSFFIEVGCSKQSTIVFYHYIYNFFISFTHSILSKS